MSDTSNTNFNQYNGIYRAIVINNNDPQLPNSGRVQVFVPEIHGVSLPQFLNGKKTFSYRFPGNNILSDLDAKTMDYLKTLCPWASPSMPVTGETGPGLYNDATGEATTSDCPDKPVSDDQHPVNHAKPAVTNGGDGSIIVPDRFSNPVDNYVANANHAGADYRAPSFSNGPKGSFAIPRVGAQLSVMFFRGDSNHPVYIGALPSAQDFANILRVDGTYPGSGGGYESRVNVTNFNPPVKPVPTQAEISTNATSTPQTEIALTPVVLPIYTPDEVAAQIAINDENAAAATISITEPIGSFTTIPPPSILNPINPDDVNPSIEQQGLTPELASKARVVEQHTCV